MLKLNLIAEQQIDLKIKENSFVCVVGRSGAGKTTMLRHICGLSSPKKGHIEFAGKIWLDDKTNIFI